MAEGRFLPIVALAGVNEVVRNHVEMYGVHEKAKNLEKTDDFITKGKKTCVCQSMRKRSLER